MSFILGRSLVLCYFFKLYNIILFIIYILSKVYYTSQIKVDGKVKIKFKKWF